jgi:hypothetical protein
MARIVALASGKDNGKVTVYDSEDLHATSNDPLVLFDAITQPYPNAIKVVWDMEEFLKPILALLPEDVTTQLNKGEKVYYDGAKLFWGVGKGQMFGVNYHKHITGNIYAEGQDETLYQLKTYFPDETVTNIEAVKIKGLLLLTTLQSMGLKPKRLTSCASIMSETILRNMNLPTIYTMPEDALECAEWAANYIREWRATYKLGVWESGIYSFDRCAAYPSIMAQLPDLRNAKYIKTDGRIPEGTIWGILKGEITINKEVSPIIYSDGKAYKGTYLDFITTDDWNCIKKWDIGTFKPEAGWFIKAPIGRYPLEYIMHRFYQYRADGGLKDYLAKHMVNVTWGKWCERREKENGSIDFGEFYFPPYACMTTSKMRCAVTDFIYSNQLQDDVVSVIVDGVLSMKPADVSTQKEFGKWRLNPMTPALVLSSSMQWVGDKKPGGVDVYKMLNDIKEHPNSTAWHGIALRFLEQEREFTELPKTGRDILENVYESRAFEYHKEID